ncbi:hypothetical protein [Sporomusa termitida]|nr:hypothetical protein [Sporomusa termitida]
MAEQACLILALTPAVGLKPAAFLGLLIPAGERLEYSAGQLTLFDFY